jgi:aminopeptidase N
MENISLVTWSDLYVMDATHFSERGLMVDLTNIHEMAHTYFGDLVVIRHFEHVWLKESWATYFEALWLQESWNQEEFEFEMYGNAERYIAETGRYSRPIVTRQYDHSWAMFDSHTYPGGGWRIHMLRCLLGDTLFWLGVQDYVRTFTGQVVETDDFRKCLEKASGTNLTKFFDQWFFSQGFPRLSAKYAFQAEKRVVTIELEQTQTEPFLSHFDISFDVEVVDSENVAHRTRVTFAQKKAFAVIQLPLKAKVKLIRIDPDVTTLFSLDFNPGEEILESTAKEAKDLFSRIRSYKELIKIGSYSALSRVGKAIKNEPFYGVRDRGICMLCHIF